MPVAPGTRLGPYEILAPIGEGGMGEVYKARDTRLDRIVAVKVSKTPFDPRFEREAHAVAALNHPNICTLHDVGPNYLVMEYVQGSELRGPLPAARAIELAIQILDALDAAHRKGITHRDLKPANVMVTKSGVKVLDFGLAKQTIGVRPDDVTLPPLTAAGQITGTLQYMSPEQLQGKDADARSDIFAFGCVLYEMLSGERAFTGTSGAGVIAAILEREPQPLKTTPPLHRVIRTCLAKDPDQRFQTARDLKRDLIWAMEKNTVVEPRKVRMPWIVAAALAIALAAGAWYVATRPVPPETRLDIVTPPTNSPASFALSPDGRRIAYVASDNGPQRLWVRSLDSTSAQSLPGTDGALNPFWSPDGRFLGFFADLKLKRIGPGGGQPQILAAVASTLAQGTWSPEGVIIFNKAGPLIRIPASGGPEMAVTSLGEWQASHRLPRFLPGGHQFLFTATGGGGTAMWLGSLDGGDPHRIAALAPETDSSGEYLASGWLIRARQNALVAQRFDAASGQLSGDPVPLAPVVGVNPNSQVGAFSTSASGTIAWRASGGDRRQLIWFNRSGQNVGMLGAVDESNLLNPELTPDGKKAAITRGAVGLGDIWMQEATRSARFTFDPADDRFAIWSPDSTRVLYSSARKGHYDLYQKPANGSGSEEVLLEAPSDDKRPNSWSPDGRFVLYSSSQNHGDLMVLPLTGDRKPFPFLSTPFNVVQGAFSSDGKWAAYQSNESGRFEVYVRPFPGPGGQWQVSIGGGISPRWRGDGKELYYVAPDGKMMATPVTAHGSTFSYGTPEALFQTHMPQVPSKQQYDVARDGRFLINTILENTIPEPIHLLLNWKPPK